MGVLDYLLLAAVALCALRAWTIWRKTLKSGGCCGGCGGDCAHCAAKCGER